MIPSLSSELHGVAQACQPHAPLTFSEGYAAASLFHAVFHLAPASDSQRNGVLCDANHAQLCADVCAIACLL